MCDKCGIPHFSSQPECYNCEKCGGKTKQDLRDNNGRMPDDKDYQGITHPFFICVSCGHTYFWD